MTWYRVAEDTRQLIVYHAKLHRNSSGSHTLTKANAVRAEDRKRAYLPVILAQ
jgi:hypothetical protein